MKAFGLHLEAKVEKAIATLQQYEKHALDFSNEGYFLAFSGGKDSCVLKHLANLASVRYAAYYNVTTIDPPELVRFIRSQHPDVRWNRPKVALLTLAAKNGLPLRRSRWCCRQYKELHGQGRVKLLGIRASESPQRAKRWSVFTRWKSKAGCFCLNPILYWTDENIWQFIKSEHIAVCSLYSEGFHRLGCVGCPMAGAGRRKQFEKWPGYKREFQRAAQKFWDSTHYRESKRGGATLCSKFASGDEYFKWWLSNSPGPRKDDCQMGLF